MQTVLLQSRMKSSDVFRAMVHILLPRILTRVCSNYGYGSCSACLCQRTTGSVRRISCNATSSQENAGKNSSHIAPDMQFLGSWRESSGIHWLNLSSRRGNFGSRHFWILPPTQMDQRSSKIATKKGAQDKKKAKLYGKMGKQIITVPHLDVICACQVYGYKGVELVLEVFTDNHNCVAATIRDVVKKSGAKMADLGSILFNFKRAGVIYVKSDKVEADDVLLAAMDTGAEDIIEPSSLDEEDDEEDEEKYIKVITPMDYFAFVRAGLQEAGIPLDVDISGLELIPVSQIVADDEAVDLNKVLMDKLLELDGVDVVFSNQK